MRLGRGALFAGIRRLRDRLLSDARFQRAAAAFPFTRPVASARARSLFDLTAGFVYSQVLHACVRLRLFERVAEGPRTPRELAALAGVPVERLERLLRSAAAIDLLESRGDDGFGLGIHGAALLGNPGAVAMIEHHALLYADLLDPVALIREAPASTSLSRFWAYARDGQPGELATGEVDAYTRLMSTSQQFVSDVVLSAYRFGAHRKLLDVGGGDGTFATAAALRHPALQVAVFDLPPVAAAARRRFDAAGIGDRASAHGGDFTRDPLPADADLVSLVRVLHDHDDERVLQILSAARRAIRPGGVLLVAEPIAGSRGAGGGSDCYFEMYLLAMGSGRPRTRVELQDFARRAGFGAFRWHRSRNPLFVGVMSARPVS